MVERIEMLNPRPTGGFVIITSPPVFSKELSYQHATFSAFASIVHPFYTLCKKKNFHRLAENDVRVKPIRSAVKGRW